MSETRISNEIAADLSKHSRGKVVTWRNNVGVGLAISARGGKFSAIMQACIKLAAKMGCSASPIKYGLCVGSSDRIGYVQRVVTPEMVGTTIAQFLAVEVKTPKGSISEEQENFLRVVREAGGKAVVARSAEEAVSQVVTGELAL